MTAVLILLGFAAAAVTYFGVERLGRRAWVPFVCRGVAWAALGVLLLNLSCPAPVRRETPLVLLDGSLSMRSDSLRYHRLRDSLATTGDVRYFGDSRPASDTSTRGRSQLAGALRAAAATGRPVVVVSDGQIEDGPELGAVLEGVAVSIETRSDEPPLALVDVRGPGRLTAGDSLVVTGEVHTFPTWSGQGLAVELRLDDQVLARTDLQIGAPARRTFTVTAPRGLPGGEHLLTVALTASDTLPAAVAARRVHVTVVPTPGIVVLADPGDWDARFLYRTLQDVADLPVRGFVSLSGDGWRSMANLEPVAESEVRRAARGADLLVVKGAASALGRGSSARGLWRWPSGENGEAQLAGDWYFVPGGTSPLAAAFAGVAVDSFPPASHITPIQAGDDEWVGLQVQQDRRGALRPVVVGGERGGSRVVTVAADGLWRWAFPGGTSEQGYRAWVAATTSWLLGGSDSTTAPARPVAPVVQRARPVQFRWAAGGDPEPLPIALQYAAGATTDTLSFDGSGTASLWLPVGTYQYLLPNGTGGVVAVEPYSDELLPRAITLQPQRGMTAAQAGRRSAREALWLFGLVILALAGEWFARRYMGLR